MTTTPFFAIATLMILLPTAIERASKDGYKKPLSALPVVVLIAAIVLPIITRTNSVVIITAVVVTIAGIMLITKLVGNPYPAITLSNLASLLVAIFVFGNSLWVPGFNHQTLVAAARTAQSYAIFSSLTADFIRRAFVAAFGLAVVTVGTNSPIALILKTSGLMPAAKEARAETGRRKPLSEPARGRAIGYLERSIVLLLILSGNAPAIGFVLAAKALARFSQLNEREFAEYVLIGTLISMGVTIVVGLILMAYMP
jgi:hypothetical protein